jgi:hypothetical protein
VRAELERIGKLLGEFAGQPLDAESLANGVQKANQARRLLASLRETVFEDWGIPAIELEVPSISDALLPSLASRLQAMRPWT